jgi:hypothetical protein
VPPSTGHHGAANDLETVTRTTRSTIGTIIEAASELAIEDRGGGAP